MVSFCVCDSLGADIQFPISVAANRDQVALAFSDIGQLRVGNSVITDSV